MKNHFDDLWSEMLEIHIKMRLFKKWGEYEMFKTCFHKKYKMNFESFNLNFRVFQGKNNNK